MAHRLFGSVRVGLVLANSVMIAGCYTGLPGGEGGTPATGGGTGEGGDGLICETEPIEGEWVYETDGIQDWRNVVTGENDQVSFPSEDDPDPGVDPLIPCAPAPEGEVGLDGSFDRNFVSHHCFTTAVHAVHLPTGENGELLLMHGEGDQRVWPIGGAPTDMRWHPIPVRTYFEDDIDADPDPDVTDLEWEGRCDVPDIFCSGHVQLSDGRVFFAGGNVTGNASDGGLNATYVFDPVAASSAVAPDAGPFSTFGWEFDLVGEPEPNFALRSTPSATYDRWYPTLTALPDGRVLIAGGESRAAGDPPARLTRVLEVFDPNFNTLQELPGGEEALFPHESGVPEYPFMFVLSNGHVFFAGSEEAAGELAVGGVTYNGYDGYVLVPSPRLSTDAWTWVAPPSEVRFGIQSFTRGGSAVMYAPNKIMKSGGPDGPGANATADTETIDLTAYAESGDPADIPLKFCSTADPDPNPDCTVEPMERPRHLHTLTLLPDGRVLATGGNYRGNAGAGESFWNPCDVDGLATSALDCDEPGVDCYVDRECGLGCPSLCVQDQLDVPSGGADSCTPTGDPSFSCSIIRTVECGSAAACTALWPEGGESADCRESVACHVDGESCVPTYTCDAILAGSTCSSTGTETGVCVRDCDCAGTEGGCTLENEFDACGDLQTYFDPDAAEGAGAISCPAATRTEQNDTPGEEDGIDGRCSPANNACYAIHSAEIWDPSCGTWDELDDQQYPRMYHSTALLLPDARVISMGGGHRSYLGGGVSLQEQPTGQYFAPAYSASGVAPAFANDAPMELVIPHPGEDDVGPQEVMIPLADDTEPVDHVTLIRLGSVTHGFDMGQSIMKLDAIQDGDSLMIAESSDPAFPFNTNTAPAGYYMAFLMSAAGEPSAARYARVTSTRAAEYVCEVDGLVIEESSCAGEPISGVCPTASVVTVALDPPLVDGVTAVVEGFRVVALAGTVGNPEAPSARELAAIASRCATACEQYYAGRDGVSASCAAPDAFLEPALVDATSHDPVDFVHPSQRQGEGLFGTQTLACDLGSTCYNGFDEVLRPVANDRVTAAASPLARDEEWRVVVGGQMGALASSGGSPVSAALSGTIGYSLCAAGNTSAPCPFHLGSLELDLDAPLVLPVTCGGTTTTHTLSELAVRLEQPAFGIAEEGTSWKAFPPGAIVIDAEGVVDSVPFHVRRPNQQPLKLRAGQAWVLMQGADGASLEFSVPCGEDEIEVLVWLGYNNVAIDDFPPQATIGGPANATCPSTWTLAKSVSDADGDLASVRWRVDGVLMQNGITSMPFTQPHLLELVVRDARGATVTKQKNVGCL